MVGGAGIMLLLSMAEYSISNLLSIRQKPSSILLSVRRKPSSNLISTFSRRDFTLSPSASRRASRVKIDIPPPNSVTRVNPVSRDSKPKSKLARVCTGLLQAHEYQQLNRTKARPQSSKPVPVHRVAGHYLGHGICRQPVAGVQGKWCKASP